MKDIFLLAGISFLISVKAQHISLYPFQPSEEITIMSRAKFDRLVLGQAAYYKRSSSKNLPANYYVYADTLKPGERAVVVTCPVESKLAAKIAFLKKDSVEVFTIWKDNIGKSIRSVGKELDLTGDGVHEVFIYYDYYHSWDSDMTSGTEKLYYVEVWDPVKRQMLLNQVLASNGHSWSMCNGSSSHSGSMELYFYPGGFSVLRSSSTSSREDMLFSQDDAEEDFRYTPAGFVKDTVNSCLFLLKRRDDLTSLANEYRRLKNNRPNCPWAPGLLRCMRLMGLSLPHDADSLQILEHFGLPDKRLSRLPPELIGDGLHHWWTDDSKIWIYYSWPGAYVYFIVAGRREKRFNWYVGQSGGQTNE